MDGLSLPRLQVTTFWIFAGVKTIFLNACNLKFQLFFFDLEEKMTEIQRENSTY